MVKISGGKAHSARLKRTTSPEMLKGFYKGLYAGGQLIEIEAEISITAGSVSGAGHVPSAPGQPPNADTRQLDGSIETTGKPERLQVKVTANAPHAVPLELGSSKMAARPFMKPATRKKRSAAVELVRKQVSRVVKQGG